jgi:hypothetical protein
VKTFGTRSCSKLWHKGMICYHQAHPWDSQPGYQQVQWRGTWCLQP